MNETIDQSTAVLEPQTGPPLPGPSSPQVGYAQSPGEQPPVEPPNAAPEAAPAGMRPMPPAQRPQGQRKRAQTGGDSSERGAMIVTLALVAVMSLVALIVGLRWQAFADEFPFRGSAPNFYQPELTPPNDEPTLRRAPNGDGTVLVLLDRPQEAGMSLQDIYQAVNPSIVSIQTAQALGFAEGTGVLMSANGYLITNAHVIQGGSRADVTLSDGRTFEALLVGSDADSDLAVLKIDVQDLTPAAFGNSDEMVVGDMVAAIGNPLGSQLAGSSTMTDGILSAVNRDLEVNGSRMTLLQTTAALNSGNSGGALVNDQGQVIGITNMKLVDRGLSAPIEGLGFAIPTTTVKAVVDSLIASGHVTGRPMLGITVRPCYPEELQQAGVEYGLLVSAVDGGSDAKAQGVKVGDIILSANDTDLYTNDNLMEVKEALGVGGTLDLVLLRGDETVEITVKLVEQYELEDR